MKTFTFYQKNSGVCVTLSAPDIEEAEEILFATVQSNYGWRCDDEEGEDEY